MFIKIKILNTFRNKLMNYLFLFLSLFFMELFLLLLILVFWIINFFKDLQFINQLLLSIFLTNGSKNYSIEDWFPFIFFNLVILFVSIVRFLFYSFVILTFGLNLLILLSHFVSLLFIKFSHRLLNRLGFLLY